MSHIKTMLCDNLIGIDKLERLKLLQSRPLISEFIISIKEPEMVSCSWVTSASPTKQYHLF
jgi:hypothetical protein